MPRRIFDEHAGRAHFTLGGPPMGHGGRRRGPAPLPAGTGAVSGFTSRRPVARAITGTAQPRAYPIGATHPTGTSFAPHAFGAAFPATPGTGRIRGLSRRATNDNELVASPAALLAPSADDVRARHGLRTAVLPSPFGVLAPSTPPPYAALCASVQLTLAQLSALSCPISLDGAETLLEPVALRSEQVLHVFAYGLLWQHWVVRGDNPLTRQRFAWDELLRVEVSSEAPSPTSPDPRPPGAQVTGASSTAPRSVAAATLSG